jgi:hypothetical protein
MPPTGPVTGTTKSIDAGGGCPMGQRAQLNAVTQTVETCLPQSVNRCEQGFTCTFSITKQQWQCCGYAQIAVRQMQHTKCNVCIKNDLIRSFFSHLSTGVDNRVQG